MDDARGSAAADIGFFCLFPPRVSSRSLCSPLDREDWTLDGEKVSIPIIGSNEAIVRMRGKYLIVSYFIRFLKIRCINYT